MSLSYCKYIQLSQLYKNTKKLNYLPRDDTDNLKLVDSQGLQVFHWAILHKDFTAVEELVSNGVDVRAKTNRGLNALHLMFVYESAELPHMEEFNEKKYMTYLGATLNAENSIEKRLKLYKIVNLLAQTKVEEMIYTRDKYDITPIIAGNYIGWKKGVEMLLNSFDISINTLVEHIYSLAINNKPAYNPNDVQSSKILALQAKHGIMKRVFACGTEFSCVNQQNRAPKINTLCAVEILFGYHNIVTWAYFNFEVLKAFMIETQRQFCLLISCILLDIIKSLKKDACFSTTRDNLYMIGNIVYCALDRVIWSNKNGEVLPIEEYACNALDYTLSMIDSIMEDQKPNYICLGKFGRCNQPKETTVNGLEVVFDIMIIVWNRIIDGNSLITSESEAKMLFNECINRLSDLEKKLNVSLYHFILNIKENSYNSYTIQKNVFTIEYIKFLLDNCISVNSRSLTDNGASVLEYAIEHNLSSIIPSLIKHGAYPHAVNKKGRTVCVKDLQNFGNHIINQNLIRQSHFCQIPPLLITLCSQAIVRLHINYEAVKHTKIGKFVQLHDPLEIFYVSNFKT